MRAALALLLVLPALAIAGAPAPLDASPVPPSLFEGPSAHGEGRAFALAPPAGAATVSVDATSYGAITTIQAFSGEPNIAAAPDGSVYVTGLGYDGVAGGTMVFKRDADATAFQYLGMPNAPYGGNDEAIAIADDGTVWISGMYGYWSSPAAPCASVTRSTDGGATWEPTLPGVCLADDIDRQWIAVDGAGDPWVVLHEICCTGVHTLHRSTDDGVTFQLTSVAAANGGFPGNLVIDRERGRVYEFTNCDHPLRTGPCVFWTSTLAPTPVWAPSLVAKYTANLVGLGHVAGAVDDAGNVYIAFIDKLAGDARASAYVARSTDGGLTWSAPVRMSEGNALATMPWVAAGADGNFAVVWYESSVGSNPNSMPASAAWNVKASLVRGWDDASSPERLTLSTAPHHRGTLCTNGAACYASGLDRNMLDFFEATVGPDGTLHVVWPDDANGYVLRVADVHAELR